MTFDVGYWKKDPDAPFATLLRVVNAYCHPEYADWDRLRGIAQNPATASAGDRMHRFKEELREALADPNQIPGNETNDTLYHAASFDDGTDERFLRRLWRELYPNEQVPGGDKEFRSDLIAIMRSEKRLSGSTVSEYTDQYHWDPRSPDAAFARLVWEQKYPDEPVPVEPPQ